MGKGDDKKKRRGGARTTVLAALLAVVAVVAVWLSDCIPGIGIGAGSDADGTAKAEDNAEPEAAEKTAENTPTPEPPLTITASLRVDVTGCTLVVGDGPPSSALVCADLCNEDDPFAGASELVIDAKQGPAGWVIEAIDCAKQEGIETIAIERE